MTDKNQIKQYLQDRLHDLESIKKEREWTTAELGDISCCKQTLAFIDSLQEEPVSEDLEEASKEWLKPQLDKSYADYGETKMMELTHFDGYAMLDAIEFGAKWQKAKDESITEDLGEYINELSKQFPEVSFAKLSRVAVKVSRWQRNQDVKNKLPKVINRTDLDEFAYQCAYDMSNDWAIDNPTWNDVENACKLGAKWKEQQMMKNSISKSVCLSLTGPYVELDQDDIYKLGLLFGDKIKLIAIKED